MTQQIGQYAEKYALRYLMLHSLVLVQSNYHSRYGEIDLIMLDGRCLCFIEVRARKHSNYGDALESVTTQKQQKTILTAQHFLQNYPLYDSFDCRFDVIALDYADKVSKLSDMTQQTVNLQWIKHAYTM